MKDGAFMFYQYPQFPMQMQSTPQQQVTPMQFVQSRESAMQFQMPNNCSVALFDQNEQRFYVKTTDASGSATLKTFSYTEDVADDPANKYATKDDIEELKKQIEEIKKGSINNERNANANGNDRNAKR
jgi:hypothetical protein